MEYASSEEESLALLFSTDKEAVEAEGCPCACGHATKAEVEYYEEIKFWLEAVAVPVIGVIGLICNMVAIPILLSR